MNDDVQSEFILGFPADAIARVGSFEGLRFNVQDYLDAIEGVSSFRRRSDAEVDSEFKQLVVYALVVCGSRVLSYRRGPKSAETRLVGVRSVGIGGHVSTHDPGACRPTYEEAMDREIAEELCIRSDYRMARIAVLNDNSDEVGRAHFGIVHVLLLEEPRVSRNEEAIAELRFEDMLQMSRAIDGYESWSRICIGSLDRLLTAAHAAAQHGRPAGSASTR